MDSAPQIEPDTPAPARSWRGHFGPALLYGRDIDSGRKVKARIGLEIAVFAIIFGVIGVRLVMFATTDSHVARRGPPAERMAATRPDIVDRNGQILATDVIAPSLYAEPRKIQDVDDVIETLTPVLPELDVNELRDRLSSRKGFVWLKREITAKQAQEIRKLWTPGIGFMSENRRVYPNNAEVSHIIGYVNIDNQGQAGIERWLYGRGLAALHLAGLATDRLQKPVELQSICASSMRCVRNSLRRRKYKAIGLRNHFRRAHR
jgi:cell division protein FtsI (penicillin-binding protein 3)